MQSIYDKSNYAKSWFDAGLTAGGWFDDELADVTPTPIAHWVLANSLAEFGFDNDASTGAHFSAYRRIGGHLWLNNVTTAPALWKARCWDTTTAPATATADFSPTTATMSVPVMTTDATGQQLVVTWTAVPCGVDSIDVTMKFRLENDSDELKISCPSVVWHGAPAKQALHQFIAPILAINGFNGAREGAFFPALDGITIGNPVQNARYANGVPGFPVTGFVGSASLKLWYPAGHQWTDSDFGFWDLDSLESWMVYIDPVNQPVPTQIQFEGDGTSMLFQSEELQQDCVIVANNARTIGSSYEYRLRPFLADTEHVWWEIERHYFDRVEFVNPTWLPPKFIDDPGMSTFEKATCPFVAIQAIDEVHSVGDGEPGDVAGMLNAIRSGLGLSSAAQLRGNADCPTHNIHLVAEDPDSDLRSKLAAIMASGNTFIANWVPNNSGRGPSIQAGGVGSWAVARMHQNLGDRAERRWWRSGGVADFGSGMLIRSRKGYIEGGGADRLAERPIGGQYYRERVYTVANWNAGTRTITVAAGVPNADGFAGVLISVLYPAAGATPAAWTLIESLSATGFVISANPGFFEDANFASVTPQIGDTIAIRTSVSANESGSPGDMCHHALVNSNTVLARYSNNAGLGKWASWGCVGEYEDTWSDPVLDATNPANIPCFRDHTAWTQINGGYVNHPLGGGVFHKASLRALLKRLRDDVIAAQAAAAKPQFFYEQTEFCDAAMLGVVRMKFHPASAGKLFRDTTGTDPTIHQYRAVPGFSVKYAGRIEARALDEEFSSWLANGGIFDDAELRENSAWNLASEWCYGITLPILSIFRGSDPTTGSDAPFMNLWDESIYQMNGGTVSNEVRQIRGLYEQIHRAEQWCTKWLRFGEMMPPPTVDLSASTTKTGRAQGQWSNLYYTYDLIYPRATHPCVIGAPWRADDGTVAIIMANPRNIDAGWRASFKPRHWSMPDSGLLKIREVAADLTPVNVYAQRYSSDLSLYSALSAYSVRIIICGCSRDV